MPRNQKKHLFVELSSSYSPPRRNCRRIAWLQILFAVLLCITLVANVCDDWAFNTSIAFAATTSHPKPGALTFAQFLKQGRQDTAYHGPFIHPLHVPPPPGTTHDKVGKTLPTAEPPTMKPLVQTLSAAFLSGGSGVQPLDLKSSDGRLEVLIQPGTFELSHASVMNSNTPGKGATRGKGTGKVPSKNMSGPLTLTISELYGYYIAENDTLGAYQFQLTNASGHAVSGVTLHTPLTIEYHYAETILTTFDLDPGHLFLGWPTLLDVATRTHPAPPTALIALHNDPKTHTVTAQSHLFGPGPFTFTGDPSDQSPPHPLLASVQGNSGQLSYSLPIQMPPGPNGFGPDLMLAYSSQSTNSRHSFNQPGGSAGDGWSLSVGAITADVHGSTSAGGATTWYNISGVDGISDRLVPNDQDPTTFVTQHYSYLLIKQVQYGSPQRPCFHVWDTSGTYYEFGCISDALQYHKDSDGTIHYYRWDLNKIVAPNENAGDPTSYSQIILSYLQDCNPYSSPCPDGPSASNGTAIRDSAPKQLTVYAGSNTIDETVDFLYMAPNANNTNGIQFATRYGNNYNCSSNPPIQTSLRCDDPLDFSGGLPAPAVMSTLSLIHVYSYLGPDTGSGSHPAYEYDLSYQDTPFSATGFSQEQCYDPTQPFGPSVYEYCAGEHLLESVTESVYNNTGWHELKPIQFNYTQLTNFYSDQNQKVPGTNNIYQIHVNVSLLTDYLDSNTGVGGHITFQTGYGNTHGTPNAYDDHGNLIDDRHDPLFCDTYGGCFTGNNGIYANPNDAQWGEQLVTSITTLGSDSNGLQAATTTYAYYLVTVNGQTCPAAGSGNSYENECVTFTWRPKNDADWQDYYDGENFGMNGVFTSSPAENVTADYYYTTEGNATDYSHYGNYTNGALYKEDVFQGNQTTGTLLRETTTDYAGDPNTYPSNSCNGNYSGVYSPCEVIPMTTTTAFCEGASGCSTNAQNPTWPWITTTYKYDDYTGSGGLGDYYSAGSYHNLLLEKTTISSSSSSPYLTKSWNYLPENQTVNGNTYYDVNKAVQSETDDASGMKWQCEGISYDEGNQAGTTPGNPVAGWPTTVNWYKGGNCSYPSFGTPFITTYSGYDSFGNVIATVDGVAAANPSFYGASGKNNANGCTLPAAPTIIGAGWNKTSYTTCTVYDPYQVQPVSVTNAFGQSNQFSYDRSQALLPVSSEDPNQKTTTTAYSYDSNSHSNDERIISVSEPGECGPPCYTKQSTTYSTCSTSIPSSSTVTSPCFEVNGNSSLYPDQASSTWYDSQGRSVESSIPAPPPVGAQSGMDYFTVSITEYNDQNDTVWQSEPFVVAVTPQQSGPTSTGWIDPSSVTDYNGHQVYGSSSFLDALGRTIAVRDAIWTKGSGLSCSNTLNGTYTACTNYGVGTAGGGTPFYDIATSIDPNNHVSKSFSDALGRVAYTKEFSGVATGTLTANEETSIQYNVLNEPTQVVATDLSPQSGQTVSSATTTATYDALGRLTQLVDPDRGTHTYSYDPDSQMLTDTSGTRTLGYNYDLLGRLGCLQDAAPTINATGTCTNGTNPYVQNIYDVSAPGSPWKGSGNDNPVGRLTQSIATTYYPDGTNATSTQNVEYDQRGRPITNQLLVNVPTSWGIGTLPTYQATIGYNDDDQPGTTQTSAILNGTSTPGYTVTEVYDPTSGVLNGLGNIANTPTSNLASQVENANSLPDTLTFYTSAGQTSKLAKDQFTYDGDLRPTEATATWQSGSGTTGQIFDQQRSYDAGSNVISLTTTLSSVPGQNNSGGSETQNFCYDEQNRLVWAGNSGTQPSPGNGTCGSGTLSNTLGGAAYSNSFVYTHLNQLWQGPLNGSSASYQYLYCNSATPHQLTGMFPTGSGASCSNQTGAVYTSSYDAWGNVTSRSYNNATATLSYDLLDQLVQWNAGSTSKEWYAYDASGNRTVRRATTGSSTTLTVYAFGGEEYTYSSTGTLQNATHYYSLGGRLIGELTGLSSPSTNAFLTDALGSVLVAFSNTQGSAAVLANQVYSPYGTQQYSGGTMSSYTNKGFTGQYADATGLDYYNARYYDPIAGVFLSADPVEGNLQGMNPYGYVAGNPETMADPTGNMYVPPPSSGGNGAPQSPPSSPPPSSPPSFWQQLWSVTKNVIHTSSDISYDVWVVAPFKVVDMFTGASSIYNDALTLFDSHASGDTKWSAVGDLLLNVGMDALMFTGIGEGARMGDLVMHEGEDMLGHAGEEDITHMAEGEPCAGGLSFIAATLVATAHGEQTIGTMHVGEKVLSYNPKSHKMELEPVLHVWINHDTDLVDLTLTHTAHAPHSAVLSKISEVLHTNQKHPFLTKEKGFVPVSRLKPGMHVLEANGTYGVVTGWKIVPGAKTMYNLEVAQDHTYTVGVGEWVVHNCATGGGNGTSWSSKSVKQAAAELDAGSLNVTVANRSEAEELFLRKFQGEGYRNTTGFSGPEVKEFYGDKYGTYHWDDNLDPEGGILGHGPDNPDGDLPHLQIHPFKYEGIRKSIHIFFYP